MPPPSRTGAQGSRNAPQRPSQSPQRALVIVRRNLSTTPDPSTPARAGSNRSGPGSPAQGEPFLDLPNEDGRLQAEHEADSLYQAGSPWVHLECDKITPGDGHGGFTEQPRAALRRRSGFRGDQTQKRGPDDRELHRPEERGSVGAAQKGPRAHPPGRFLCDCRGVEASAGAKGRDG